MLTTIVNEYWADVCKVFHIKGRHARKCLEWALKEPQVRKLIMDLVAVKVAADREGEEWPANQT